MNWIESFIAYIAPSALIDTPAWRDKWQDQQRDTFVRLSRFAIPACGIAWLLHYPFFDIPMGLEPRDLWFNLRVGLGTVCLALGALYFTPLIKTRHYRIPAFVFAFVYCHAQAWVAVWYGKEAWFFFFLFVLIANLLLRLSPVMSIVWGAIVVGASAPVLAMGGVSTQEIASGAIAVLTISAFVRASAITDVRMFIATQTNEESQQQIFKMNQEFMDRLQSFIPKVIGDRLLSLMDKQRLTALEASVEVLQARRKDVACLFTDIRGFTQGSKNLGSFIEESVLPEVTACSDTIENYSGIPRKVGDLIFAYFDDQDMRGNVIRALASSVELARINETFNTTLGAEEIRRYILLSSGEALVGNFGGLDSSIEITALGSPVNFLSRLDDATKHPALAALLIPGDILVAKETVEIAESNAINLPFERLDLRELKVDIRDFPEVDVVFRLTPNDDLYDSILALVDSYS